MAGDKLSKRKKKALAFRGKKVSKEEEDRLNALQTNVESIMDAAEKEQKGGKDK